MNTEELIIQLIQQHMKHQQMVEYICKAGFESDMHGLDIPNIVAKLMNMEEIPDHWMEVYMDCMGNTVLYPLAGRSDAFRDLALECYMLLKNNMP